MIRKMNKVIFSQYLDMAINEIQKHENIKNENHGFLINPVVEPGKILNAKDEVMRLQILNKKKVENHIFSKEEVVSMLTFFSPLVPVWINLSYVSECREKLIFNLDCSLRLRKPSLLRNQELGHPPFRVVDKRKGDSSGQIS